MALRTMKIAVIAMNIKIKHKKIEHNPNQKSKIDKKKSEKSDNKECRREDEGEGVGAEEQRIEKEGDEEQSQRS